MSEQALLGSAPVKEPPKFQAPKKKKKWLKPLIALLIVAAVAVLFLKGAMGGGNAAVSGTYLPAQAEERPLTVTVTGPGTVKPNDTFRATTLIKGEVLSAPFEEGDTVAKDAVLFTIDASDVEDAVEQMEIALEQAKDTVASAQAGIQQAEDNYRRAQVGVEQAQAGVEQAELSVRSAQMNYDNLLRDQKDNVSDRQVKANATGVVDKLYVDPGDTVSAGTPIADILDREQMKLTVPFHSVDAKSFYVGQAASVTVSGTAETLYGRISELSATDSVGPGGTLVRNVTIVVDNPGALSGATTAAASVGAVSSASTGSFAYNASKQLVALYSGKLESLTIVEGSRVTDGQVVGMFEEKSFQDQIDAAAIALDNAKVGLKTANAALENAQISLSDAQTGRDTAQISLRNAQLAQANAENNLESAKENLDDYTITSPIDGTVIEKNYKAGDNYDPSTASTSGSSAFMAVIYDMSRLTFDINVSERDVVKLSVGQKVTFTADALDSAAFTGVVEKININGTTVNGNTSYPVTVAVDGSGTDLAGQGLLPGMSVSANIIIEEAGTVLTIPVDAVSRGNVVLVAGEGALDKDGALVDPTKLEEREVVLGRNDAEYIEVLSGLEAGETVYIQNTSSNFMQAMMGM